MAFFTIYVLCAICAPVQCACHRNNPLSWYTNCDGAIFYDTSISVLTDCSEEVVGDVAGFTITDTVGIDPVATFTPAYSLACPDGGEFFADTTGAAQYTRDLVTTFPFGTAYRHVISAGCKADQLLLVTTAANYTVDIDCTGWFPSCAPDNLVGQVCGCSTGYYTSGYACSAVTLCENFTTLEGPSWDRECLVTSPQAPTAAPTQPPLFVPVSLPACRVLLQATSNIVDDYMFECLLLTTVTMSYTVTAVGDRAFSGCANLDTLKLSTNLEVIGAHAFDGCAITTLALHTSTHIGDAAFSNIVTLTSVFGQISWLGDSAFAGCTSLNDFPALVNCTLGQDIFTGTLLTDLTLSNCSTVSNSLAGSSIVDLTLQDQLDGSLDVPTKLTVVNFTLPADLSGSSDVVYNSPTVYALGDLVYTSLLVHGESVTLHSVAGAHLGVLDLSNVTTINTGALNDVMIGRAVFNNNVDIDVKVFTRSQINNMQISNCSTMRGPMTDAVCKSSELPGVTGPINIISCTSTDPTDYSCTTCPADHYHVGTECKYCDGDCPAGTYVVELCTGDVNVVCAACSPTTWISDFAHRHTKCLPRTCENNPHPHACAHDTRKKIFYITTISALLLQTAATITFSCLRWRSTRSRKLE